MGRSIFDQDTQVKKSFTYNDGVAPSLANYETNPTNLEDDLNNLRSQEQNILNRNGASFPTGDWYADITAPSALEAGSSRGVNALNGALHLIEKKRVLRDVTRVGIDVTVTAAQNWEILGTGELPVQTTAAVGTVTTLGTVVAYNATFGAHSLAEVAGPHALNPKNLCMVVDADTGDPILSSGRQVWALLQSETATDGHTITDATPTRVQLSFVRPNAAFDDLEACPVGDIAGKTINYTYRERVRLEDLTEADFLRGAVVDIGGGAITPSRQVGYDNQGTTPVEMGTHSFLDLGTGLEWTIRDVLNAALLRIVEGSTGGATTFQLTGDVDIFDVNAVTNDFLNGASFDTGAAGTTINVGVTANQIDSGGALKVASGGSGNLNLSAAGELNMTDGYRSGSTWSLTDGLALADSSAEWSSFETAFGEVSLLNAIVQAKNASYRRRVWSVCTTTVPAGNDASGPSNDNNLDTDLGSLAGGTFTDDYDLYLNGQYLRPGANASANHDFYPGTSLANGQLMFEFVLHVGDQLCLIDRTP
jgi:hypothetical protein